MSEIVSQYSGEGTFHFVLSKEIILDLGFTLTQYSDAKIEIVCYFIPRTNFPAIADLVNMNNEGVIDVSMDGKVQDPNGKIRVEKAFIASIYFNFDIKTGLLFKLFLRASCPVEIVFKEIKSNNITACAGLTNFVFGNCKTTDDNFNGLKVDIEDFSVYFKHHENYNAYISCLKDLEETTLVTSEAIIDFSNKEINFTEIMNYLSDLLSYACRTRISHIYEDYYFEDQLFKTVLRPVITNEFNKGNNLIDSNHFENCNLKFYLETCYTNYLEFKDKFALNIVISFYLDTITHNYLDIAFLVASTTLETILNGYGELREEEGNPITLGLIESNKKKIMKVLNEENILISEEVTQKVAEKISYKNLSIQEKLSAFIKDPRFSAELNKYDRDFSLIRNKIAHTGKFPEKIDSNCREREIFLHEEFNRLIYLIDRIILSILKYEEKPFISKLDGSITVLESNS